MALKRILFFTLYCLGITPLFFVINRKRQRIITYHHILPDKLVEDNLLFGYAHRIRSFRKQLSLLTSKLTPSITFGIPNSFMLTFDDGAKNNYSFVFPLLKELGLKAYFFILESRLNSKELLWSDKWFLWLSKVPEGNYTILKTGIRISDDKSRLTAHTQLWKLLRTNFMQKENILSEMDRNFSFGNFSDYIHSKPERFSFMDPQEIEEMKKEGNLIGRHGYDHNIMSCQEKDDITKELTKIKQNNIYNSPAYAIAFGKDGDFNEKVLKLILDSGFSPVLSNQENKPFANCLPRINLPDTLNKYEIYFYLSGLNAFLAKFRV